ncbi:MAG TPA: hypothetical protein VL549_09560 [Gemmatimonadales bacterium]|jgi:hypothetical protein|nr:hypothetical protein [Gemmatimonadales bacterium]
MRTHAIRGLALLSLCAAIGVSTACRPKPARGNAAVVAVTDIDLGRSLKSDRTIDDHASNFRPSDIVYVTVGTKGEGTGTVKARWIYGDNREIATQTRDIGPDDRRVTFQLSQPNGLAKGDYKVEISLNDVSQGGKSFSVD